MTITSTPGGTLVTGDHIPIVQLMSLKGAVKLEALGMRRKGRSAKRIAIETLKLPRGAGFDTIIGALNKRIQEMAEVAT